MTPGDGAGVEVDQAEQISTAPPRGSRFVFITFAPQIFDVLCTTDTPQVYAAKSLTPPPVLHR